MTTTREKLRILLLFTGVALFMGGIAIIGSGKAEDGIRGGYDSVGYWSEHLPHGRAVPKKAALIFFGAGVVAFTSAYFSRNK